MVKIREVEEFMCRECGRFMPIKHKGRATLDGKPYDACQWCCHKEQEKQFYCSL